MGQCETVVHTLFEQVEPVQRHEFPKGSGRRDSIAFDLDSQAREAAHGFESNK